MAKPEAKGNAARELGVGEVARVAHVTVRTLHHYDAIGLVVPSGRTVAGYRRYSADDLRRLHQVVLLRELGLSLEAIQRTLDDPTYDRRAALEAQRALLIERTRRNEAILRGVERAIAEIDGEGTMTNDERFEGFEAANASHAREAEERWGKTDAFRESARRTKTYSKEDWKRFEAETEAAGRRWIEIRASGAAPTEARAMDAAEEARLQIDRWFYPCSHEMHAKLADLYEADPRFRATYEAMAPGMAAFVAAAIRANGARAGSEAGS